MFGIGEGYRIVFHDTEYPSSEEHDVLENLELTGWQRFGYGRKYDGISFELGFLNVRKDDANSHPILAEIFSPEFTEWMNSCYRNSNREAAEYCTLLISKNYYRKAICDSLCNIEISTISSIRIGEFVMDNSNDIYMIASSFEAINPYFDYREFSPHTPFVIEQKTGNKLYYCVKQVKTKTNHVNGVIINFSTSWSKSFCPFICVFSEKMASVFENLRIKF